MSKNGNSVENASCEGAVSRRSLLQGVALAAGAVAGTAAMLRTETARAGNMTQAAAKYQPKPQGDQSCANCALFQPPTSCALVQGPVAANGWCKFYSKKS